VTINANNMDMCRFPSRDDDGYRKIKWAISSYFKSVANEIERQNETQKNLRNAKNVGSLVSANKTKTGTDVSRSMAN